MVKEIATKNNHSAPSSLELEVAQGTVDLCKHYWLIDSPNGPKSLGKCKYCSEERFFSNSAENDKFAQIGVAWRGRGRMVIKTPEEPDDEENY